MIGLGVDIIFLSNAKTPDLYAMTQQAVQTCAVGARPHTVNIRVLEQQDVTPYELAVTVKMPVRFRFNAFANFGARLGDAEWLLIANNDLIFHDGWLSPLLAAQHPVVSPKCPVRGSQAHITENTTGYANGVHFSGWCFMIARDLWARIGGFDECVEFWCSDDVVIEQLRAFDIAPMLVADSHVEHLGSQTLRRTADPNDQLTLRQLEIFRRKYPKGNS